MYRWPTRKLPVTRAGVWIYGHHFLRWKSTKRVITTHNAVSISRRLTELLSKRVNNSDSNQQKELMDITKSFLNENIPLREEAEIIAKLRQFKTLHESFWINYVVKLDKLLYGTDKLRQNGDTTESTDEDKWNKQHICIQSLLYIARALAEVNVHSSTVATTFAKWIKSNGYYLVPNQMASFNGLLEYLAHLGYAQNVTPEDFDVVAECVQDIKPYQLVDTLYLLGKLHIKNEAMITTVGRVLHNEIAMGRLTPYDKTKLARAYAMLRHEHITFFKHIAEELRIIFEAKDAGKGLNVPVRSGNRYIDGVETYECCHPSGVICSVLPYMNTDLTNITNGNQQDKVIFTWANEQLYTDGQIIYILDSMLCLNLHHLEPYFKKLLNSAIKHCYKTSSLEQFDVEQLRSALTLLARCRKTREEHVLEIITRRFVQAYVDGKVRNVLLAFFLKELVKQTREIVKTVNRRSRVCFKAKFIPPKWLGKPLSEAGRLPSGRNPSSMIEACCMKICENVYSFNMGELTSIMRSLAYLGFRNEQFYQAFIPYFKEHISTFDNVGIANLTQALTRVNIKDDHLFYLMSKQHQLYLHGVDKAHKLYVKRIG